MKKLNVVIIFVAIMIFAGNCVLGATNLKSSNISKNSNVNNNVVKQIDTEKEVEEMENTFNTLLGVGSSQDTDIKEIFLKPLELLWLFFKALFIVIAINVIANIFCKGAFSYSDIIKKRIKARKLNKVLRDLYD